MDFAERLHLPAGKALPAAGPPRRARSDGGEAVRAPMPAQVRAVQVPEGEVVEQGQTLLLLEAMKMEIRIKAPAAGRVDAPAGEAAGQTVEKDQVLVGDWGVEKRMPGKYL